MHRSIRRTVALASAALATCAVAVPLTASPALAAGATEKAFVVADKDGDGYYGLYTEPVTGGTLTPIVSETGTVDVFDESSSADGSRVAFVRDVYASVTATEPSSEQVVVADISAQIVRVVASVSPATGAVSTPSLSPDGNTVVWSQFSASGVQLRKAAVGSGASSLVATGVFGGLFLNGTTLLVGTPDGKDWTMPAAGGTKTAVTGSTIPAATTSITVSSDGSQIMWSEDTTPTNSTTTTASIGVAPLSVTNGVANVGTVATLTSSGDNEHPAFSRDGLTAYWASLDNNTGAGTLEKRLVDKSTAQVDAGLSGGFDTPEVAIGTTDDGTAPGSATTLPATLSGTSATVRWTLPGDADLSGVKVTRSYNGTVQKTYYVPAPVVALTDSGLVPGYTYTYSFTTYDRSGNVGTAALRQLVATSAGATFSTPTSATATHAPFAVRFGTSAGSTTYVVDYLVGGTTTWKPWVMGAAGQTRTFGSAATTGINATTSVLGASYAFRVTATDAFGNTTSRVTSGRAVVPYDQTKATLSGGLTVSSSSAWMGTVRVLSSATNYAVVGLTGNQLQIIGWKCRSCGAFDVYDGSIRVATIDSYAASGMARVVLYTRTYSAVGYHKFTIRPRGTAGRPNVYLDGFGNRT